MLEPVTLLSKEERRLTKEKAVRQAEEEKSVQLQQQQFVVDRLKVVDTTLRLPLTVGLDGLAVARSLSRRLYEDIVSLPGGFRRLILGPNSHKDELGSHVMEFDAHATGIKSSVILSAKHAFGVTAIFTLQKGIVGTLSNIRKTYSEQLKTSVASFTRESPPFQSVSSLDTTDFRDAERWAAYLPMHSRVGLYRKNENLYLIIVTNAGDELTASVDEILSEEGMTIGKFVTDRRVHRLKNVVLRNVRRVASRIISDLNGLEGQSLILNTDDDPYTRLSNDLSYYELARPTLVVKHNHMRLDARNRSVRVYIDATCSSAVLYGDRDYVMWCGRTRDYLVAIRPNDNDASVLPLNTDKLALEERTRTPEEEHELIGTHVQYLTPRSETVGAFIKYRTNPSINAYKHVSSVHI